MRNKFGLLIYVLLILNSCSNKSQVSLIESSNFNEGIQNKKVHLFTLRNSNGMISQITNLGGKVVSLWVVDANGNYEDVVLGFDTAEKYIEAKEKYFGALIGRYGNRIANGTFKLNDSIYSITINNGVNHLHGGLEGYNAVVWDAEQKSESKLELTYLSKDGEEGYPGNVLITTVYELKDDNSLAIKYRATTDKSTPINLTHHSFFNLKGAGKGTINDHLLQINANYFTPINKEIIPTGEIISVQNTPFDFRRLKSISNGLYNQNEQLEFGSGYDHNFVVNGAGVRTVAKVVEPTSGRVMEVVSDEPGIQFYGGNFLSGTKGKNGKTYEYRGAFCLETQHFPNSPNQPNFPSTILNPGEIYTSICIYKFSTQP
ncbi:aldose epimerase family protein [Urechidicola vernalis]|uniref:Aldose 1-epimerase n=1 Tax=Urechidicola vernalis TaxID=3075600 RepID=A0ABU2Y4J1_9FLAO|nr:aldose epimerase family protein [Urechidicola sp. P050]MDT0553070.1 aldose epimerase family protein [Urechidicola sp. P050]